MNKARFVCNVRIHIRDNLFGNAVLIHSKKVSAKSRNKLLETILQEFDKYIDLVDDEPTPEKIKGYIRRLKQDGWGDRRIKNHFAKYGIDVGPNMVNIQKTLDGM